MNRAIQEIRETSYGRAVEQAICFAEMGMTPAEAIAAVNLTWGNKEPTWNDAVYVLAYAWRRHCSGLSRKAFEAVPVERHVERPAPQPTVETEPEREPAATKRLRRCLKCDTDFMSAGPQNRICPRCAKRNEQIAGGFAA